jgi:hypothetical protein
MGQWPSQIRRTATAWDTMVMTTLFMVEAEERLVSELEMHGASRDYIQQIIGHPVNQEFTREDFRRLRYYLDQLRTRGPGGRGTNLPTERLDGKPRKRTLPSIPPPPKPQIGNRPRG